MKKMISLWMTVVMSVMLLAPAAVTKADDAVWMGEGSEDSPYLIASVSDMRALADRVNGGDNCSGIYFRLTVDIDLAGSEENQWTPIGASADAVFAGVFDGGGHEVKGLYINTTEGDYQALFGCVKGKIQNMTVDGTVTSKAKYAAGICAWCGDNLKNGIENCRNKTNVSNDGAYTGGVCGYNEKTKVNLCVNEGTISYIKGYTINNVGGIFGKNRYGNVSMVYNSGTIVGDYKMGGIAGDCDGFFTDCYNTGDIIIDGKNRIYAGGICGFWTSMQGVKKCYNIGTMKRNFDDTPGDKFCVGSLVGEMENTYKLISCYYLEDGSGLKDTGHVGKIDEYATLITTEEFAEQSTFTDWDFDNVWIMSEELNRPVFRSNLETVSYTVRYDKPEDVSGEAPTDARRYDKGSRVPVSDVLPYSKDGYIQIGWTNVKNGTTAIDSFVITDNTILYPVFVLETEDTPVPVTPTPKPTEATPTPTPGTPTSKPAEATSTPTPNPDKATPTPKPDEEISTPTPIPNRPTPVPTQNVPTDCPPTPTPTPVPSQDVEDIRNELGVSAETAEKIMELAKRLNIRKEILYTTEKTITRQKSEEIEHADFRILKAKAAKAKKREVTIKWSKIKEADGYQIFGNQCGRKNRYKLLKTVKNKYSLKQKKLKQGKYYKYAVIAYKIIDGEKVTIAASKTVHVTTTGGKYGVAKSVKVNKAKVELKKNQSFRIKAKEIKKDKKIKRHRNIAFESSNPSVATVDKKGVIKAKKRGSCTVYVYAQNGVYKAVKVKVK